MNERLNDLQHDLKDTASKIWLAGLGAFSTASEEGSKLFRSLVEKGQEFESREDSPVGSVKKGVDQAKDRAGDMWGRIEDSINDKVAMALQKVGVPTREEIQQLTQRVDALMEAINRLDEEKGEKKEKSTKSTKK